MSGTYGASPIKRRQRRSKEKIEAIKTAIKRELVDENQMTVRQVFYRLVSLGVIDKTEAEYKTTICRLLTDMRRNGEIAERSERELVRAWAEQLEAGAS